MTIRQDNFSPTTMAPILAEIFFRQIMVHLRCPAKIDWFLPAFFRQIIQLISKDYPGWVSTHLRLPSPQDPVVCLLYKWCHIYHQQKYTPVMWSHQSRSVMATVDIQDFTVDRSEWNAVNPPCELAEKITGNPWLFTPSIFHGFSGKFSHHPILWESPMWKYTQISVAFGAQNLYPFETIPLFGTLKNDEMVN